jgi:hypothetical protein
VFPVQDRLVHLTADGLDVEPTDCSGFADPFSVVQQLARVCVCASEESRGCFHPFMWHFAQLPLDSNAGPPARWHAPHEALSISAVLCKFGL